MPLEKIISNSNTIGILNEGDDTAFQQQYTWTPDESLLIYRVSLSMAFGLNCSAFTSGSLDLNSVALRIRQEFDAPVTLTNRVFSAQGLTALTATGTQIMLLGVQFFLAPETFIKGGVPLSIRFTANTTISGTNTSQVGLMPVFPYQSEAINKIFTTPFIKFHVHTALTHAFPVLRTQDPEELLDYSGESRS